MRSIHGLLCALVASCGGESLPPPIECTPAACDDGEPCTDDSCSASGECVHTPRRDGTACDGDAICVAAACRTGTRLAPIAATTGWASSEGGFNRNHAELRCGDDGRGTGAEYQLYPGLSFEVSPIPTASTVEAAFLYLYQVRVDGDAPYGEGLHAVVAEHVRYTNMWEADEVVAITETIGQRVVATSRDLGWLAPVDIREAVAYEREAAHDVVQLRLRFVPAMADEDFAIDWAVFASDDADAALRPYVIAVLAP